MMLWQVTESLKSPYKSEFTSKGKLKSSPRMSISSSSAILRGAELNQAKYDTVLQLLMEFIPAFFLPLLNWSRSSEFRLGIKKNTKNIQTKEQIRGICSYLSKLLRNYAFVSCNYLEKTTKNKFNTTFTRRDKHTKDTFCNLLI